VKEKEMEREKSKRKRYIKSEGRKIDKKRE